MSHTPDYDAKVKAVLDATEPGERVCPISGKTWVFSQEDIERCRKWNVPPSRLHPFMRMKVMASWGAGVDLWWKPHVLTGKPILTSVHPDALPPVVMDKEYFGSDLGAQYAMDVDPARPFFAQHRELISKVPMPAFQSHGSENCVGGGYIKSVNTFMLFGTYAAKDSWYVFRCRNVDACMDGAWLENCEQTYSSCMAVRLHGCTQVFDSIDCLSGAFLFDCRNCEDCFCSSNLRRARCVFMNKQLTKEEYEKKMVAIDLSCTSTFEEYREKFHDLLRSEAVWPEHFNVNSPGCSGDYLLDCVRSSGYFGTRLTDVRDGWFVFTSENCESVVIGNDSQNVYQTCVSLASQNVKYGFVLDYCSDVEYSIHCQNLEHCFGCVGLQRKKFCIFNKQYTEEEYWKKLDEIKCAMLDRGEYGEWWPSAYAGWWPQYGFASVFCPFSKEELDRLQAPHFDPAGGMRYAAYQDTSVKDIEEVPDCVKGVDATWLNVPFLDAEEGRRYSVNDRELAFRKDRKYPFPRRHFRHRLIELVEQVNGPEQKGTSCGKCNKVITVSVNKMFPNRKVYCYPCYLAYLEKNG